MKRFVAGLVSLVIVSGAAFAKTWTNHIGVGLGVPVESVEPKDSDKIVQAGIVFDATYIGVHSNGFTVKAGFDSGAVGSDDVKIQGDDMNTATFVAFNLGAGYSFVRTDKVLFGTTAMFTGAFNMYEEKTEHGGKNYTDSVVVGAFGIGADVYGVYNIGNHFGFYANLGLRYIFDGVVQAEVAGNKADSDVKGNVFVLPSLGVIWHF